MQRGQSSCIRNRRCRAKQTQLSIRGKEKYTQVHWATTQGGKHFTIPNTAESQVILIICKTHSMNCPNKNSMQCIFKHIPVSSCGSPSERGGNTPKIKTERRANLPLTSSNQTRGNRTLCSLPFLPAGEIHSRTPCRYANPWPLPV